MFEKFALTVTNLNDSDQKIKNFLSWQHSSVNQAVYCELISNVTVINDEIHGFRMLYGISMEVIVRNLFVVQYKKGGRNVKLTDNSSWRHLQLSIVSQIYEWKRKFIMSAIMKADDLSSLPVIKSLTAWLRFSVPETVLSRGCF